jgi:uncharacterized protein (TIGR03437 family)
MKLRHWGLLIAATMAAGGQTPATMGVVSAASYARDAALAPEMIATGFTALIAETAAASGGPLPQTLAGYSVLVRDAAGAERQAGLYSVGRGQISFLIPAGTAAGAATVALRRGTETVATAAIRVAAVSPGIFTANGNGAGAPAGLVLTVSGGERRFDNLFQTLAGDVQFVPKPFDAATSENYLMLFGTGFRGAGASTVRARLGGVEIPVQGVAAQGQYAGLDQINLGPIPAELGRRLGQYELELTFSGAAANRVTVAPSAPSAGEWSTRAALPEANSEMAIAEAGGRIFIFGGYPASRVTVATLQAYDAAADSWTLAAPLPLAVNHAMAASWGGKLYLIGGQTDANVAYSNRVQEYDPASNTWRDRAPMPTARSSGVAAVIEDKIYVAGGRPPRGADFAVYDPREDKWTTLPDLPTQRNHLAGAAIGGKFYVAGGRFEGGFQSTQADSVEIYDPKTNTWTRGAAMLKPRGGLNGIAAHGCLHIFGGEFATGVHPDHDVYDPVRDRWEKLPNLPIPVHGVTGAAFVGGLIYLPGGGTMQGGSSGSRLHQVYRPDRVCR